MALEMPSPSRRDAPRRSPVRKAKRTDLVSRVHDGDGTPQETRSCAEYVIKKTNTQRESTLRLRASRNATFFSVRGLPPWRISS